MVEARVRGYFGIGVEGVSKSANAGALLRTAHAFGASFCFTIGRGWEAERETLAAMAADGLLDLTPTRVTLTRDGRKLARVVAAVFDTYLASGRARHSVAV